MIARIESELPAPASRAWTLLQKTSTFRFITRGALRMSGSDDWPETWAEGTEVQTRLWMFSLIPLWRHRLRIDSIDDDQMVLQSVESGGPVSRWNHRIAVVSQTETSCRYSDEVEIRAGILTPFIALFAHLFYRYRQRRWRRLVRTTRA